MNERTLCLSDDEVLEGLERCRPLLGAPQVRLLEYCRELDERDYCGEWGAYPTPAMFLAAELGISHWLACRYVKAGHALKQLPTISSYLSSGRFSLEKVLELARFATAEQDLELAEWAAQATYPQVKERADRETARTLEDEKTAEEQRHIRWWKVDDGRQTALAALMPTAQASVIIKAIERRVEQVPAMEYDLEGLYAFEDDAYPQRCADALAWICSQQIASDHDADRATVVLHMEAGTEAAASLESGGFVHRDILRRLACDCRLEVVGHDHDGEIIGIGRASRNIPRWLHRQLKKRDGGCCRFPGCHRMAYLQGHHIWHWEHGGPTDLDNLVLVCYFHHKLLHEFGWKVELRGSEVSWFRPDGAPFVFGPAPPEEPVISIEGSLPHTEWLPAVF